MLQTFVVGCCVEEKGEEAPDVGTTRVATWPQYSRNMGMREEKLLMLDVSSNRVRNIFTTRSQHARNINSMDFKSNG
jgi:hypothetical protein